METLGAIVLLVSGGVGFLLLGARRAPSRRIATAEARIAPRRARVAAPPTPHRAWPTINVPAHDSAVKVGILTLQVQ